MSDVAVPQDTRALIFVCVPHTDFGICSVGILIPNNTEALTLVLLLE
jgi:hypothetical protein